MPANFYALKPEDIINWPAPNYEHPSEERTWLPVFAIVWQVVTTILVWGRLYLRMTRKAGAWGYDDGLTLFAWLFSIGLTTLACLEGREYGLSRHTWDVPPFLYWKAAQAGYFAQLCFLWSTFGIKLSVLLFYRRMVKDSVSRAWMYTIWVFIGITVGAYLGVFVTYMNICAPLEAYWLAYRFNPVYTTAYTCIDGQAFDLGIAVLLGCSDIWSVVIPCMMLRHYQLDVGLRQRIALNLIFCLGFLATGAGIARSYYLWQIAHKPDIFWYGFDLYVWSLIECHLAIICTCLPSLRAFFRYYFGEARRNGTSNNRSGNRSANLSANDSARRDSRRFSKRNTKDSWHAEMTNVRTVKDFPPHSPHSPDMHSPPASPFPREKYSPDVVLYPKHSIEDMS